MKTVTIPFDLELAKKIQNGEMEGEIVDRAGIKYEILKYDAKGISPLICVYFDEKQDISLARSFTTDGKHIGCSSYYDLQLELPWYLTYEDGQYVTMETKDFTYVLIYNFYMKERINPVHYHVFFNTTDKDLHFNSCCDDGLEVEVIRPSLLSEIELMHDLLRQDGKKWNPETKQVEDMEKEPEHEFKPFDRILARDDNRGYWRPEFFSYKDEEGNTCCCGGVRYVTAIPYEGNEHLAMTTISHE